MPACVQCKLILDEHTAVCPSCRSLQPRPKRRALAKGTQIERGYGRIVVEDKIGSGAMGTVYRAWLFWDPHGPRAKDPAVPLALKQLTPQASTHAELRAFFQNEAEALRLLAHPNVVRFHDLFEFVPEPTFQTGVVASVAVPSAAISSVSPSSTGSEILAMEYVDGDNLEAVVARNVARSRIGGAGALPGLAFPRAWSYFQQLLGALAATHALGIVHRDVKPSNVMIRRDGIVKLTDFGIAHLANPQHASKAPSPQELAPGTGAYMSPEQVLGQQLDGRSDLYSAAIVLYEMLAGRPPFLPSERSEFALRMDQVETPPPSITRLVPQAPPALEGLFQRALAKSPQQRFGTAIEMGEAFRAGFGFPSTPEWAAQGEIARVAAERPRVATSVGGIAAEKKLATLRQIVAQRYCTAPMAARPARP